MIAVDWGSTSLRAYRLAPGGAIRDVRRADVGALGCADHAATLAAQIEGWDDKDVVLCGAIGGRGGWREVPYVDCPATASSLAAALLDVESDNVVLRRRSVRVVPGVRDPASPVADTMRGEETQVVGLMASLQVSDGTVCLPGTHSKWVRLEHGAIVSVHTAMTGEVYALLRRHSVLSRLMAADEPALDAGAFDAGVRRSRDPGGLLHHVFGVRTRGLLGELAAAQAPSYLSGILIGHEIQSRPFKTHKVFLVAGERLGAAYARALDAFEIQSEHHPEELAAAGMHALTTTA